MSEPKNRIIWVPEAKAEEYERAVGEAAQLEVINGIIESSKKSMRQDIEALDEDAARFKGILIGYKQAYGSVLEEHLRSTYKVWEDIDAKLPNTKAMAQKLVSDFSVVKPALESTLDLIKDLSDRIFSINTHQLVRMVDLINAIEAASPETKAVLKAVLSAGVKA